MATEEFSKDKSNQQSNVKYETLEKGSKRKYTRKSRTDEKAKEIVDQMINEQTNEQIIEPCNRQVIEEKYDQRIHDLIISEGVLEARLSNQQLAYRLPSNHNVKVAVTDSFDIDVFAQMNKYKIENGKETKELVQNRVVAPNTSIRETKNNQRDTFKYEAINDQGNASHLASLREILDKWNIDIEMSYKDYAQQQHDRIYGVQINDEGTIEQMNDELAQACVDGLNNIEIHNYPQPINMEVSLLSIFCGQYGIANESIRAEGMKTIRQFNKLSANADKNNGQASSNGERKPNPLILTKFLRYHNKEYYEQIIKPQLKKKYIDLQDGFTLIDMQEKAANGEYENEEQIVMDLTRLLVYYEGETEDIYVIKGYYSICDTQVLYHKLEGTVYKQLEKININFKNKKTDEKTDDKKDSKQLTAKHIFKKYASKFAKKGYKFISEDPKILTVFQGNFVRINGFGLRSPLNAAYPQFFSASNLFISDSIQS
ncbi:MAG: hypothetical protein EZS28_034874 [Streblomastix strix]|uniref:Uncharacterized protein n=1 Tax=Streblomastix strix TaxID=222440 RepID=A0A5J4UGA0_9EUKA|nr:MAG: hypothetical protein EZS28_034874 [Streblomastix strix]